MTTKKRECSPEEYAEILRLHDMGLGVKPIATLIGRSQEFVSTRVNGKRSFGPNKQRVGLENLPRERDGAFREDWVRPRPTYNPNYRHSRTGVVMCLDVGS